MWKLVVIFLRIKQLPGSIFQINYIYIFLNITFLKIRNKSLVGFHESVLVWNLLSISCETHIKHNFLFINRWVIWNTKPNVKTLFTVYCAIVKTIEQKISWSLNLRTSVITIKQHWIPRTVFPERKNARNEKNQKIDIQKHDFE